MAASSIGSIAAELRKRNLSAASRTSTSEESPQLRTKRSWWINLSAQPEANALVTLIAFLIGAIVYVIVLSTLNAVNFVSELPESPTLFACFRDTAVFGAGGNGTASISSSDVAQPDLVAQVMLGVAVMCIVVYGSALLTRTARLKRHAAVCGAIIFVETVITYCILVSGIGAVDDGHGGSSGPVTICARAPVTDGFGNAIIRNAEPIRYLYWLAATPPMLVMLCSIGNVGLSTVSAGVVSDGLMILCGFLAIVCSGYGSTGGFAFFVFLSLIFYIRVLRVLCISLRNGYAAAVRSAAASTRSPKGVREMDVASTRAIAVLCPVAFAMFIVIPTFWICCWCFPSLVSPRVEASVWPVLDVFVKACFTQVWVTSLDAQTYAHLQFVDRERSAADARNDAKRKFMRYIFHELRVPLNAIFLGLE